MAEESTHSGMNVFDLGKVSGVALRFDYWVRKRGFVPADERLRKIMQEREANDWENGTLWRLAAKGGQAQNPVLLAARPGDAQIMHLEGPLTFALKWGEIQVLQPWPKTTIFDVHIGTPALPPRNCNYRLFSPLTEMEIPRNVHPRAKFEFPPKFAGIGPGGTHRRTRPAVLRRYGLRPDGRAARGRRRNGESDSRVSWMD